MKNTCLKTLVASNVQIYEIEYCNKIKDLKYMLHTYKKKMNTYCVKCKRDTEILTQKCLEQKIE